MIFTLYFNKEIILFIFIQQNNLKKHSEIIYFIFTNITEILFIYIKIILFINFQTTFIFFLYNTFIFLIPAFFKLEYLYIQFILQIFFSLIFFM